MDPIYEAYQKSNSDQVDEGIVNKHATLQLGSNIYDYLMSFSIDESHIAGQQIGTAVIMAFNEAFDRAEKDRKEAFKKFVVSGLNANHF